MSLANVKRGDTVCHVDFGWRKKDAVKVADAVVVAAGPKYITVGRARFCRNSGALVTEYSPREWIYATRAEWEAQQERDALMERVVQLVHCARWRDMANERLAAIAELLEPPK